MFEDEGRELTASRKPLVDIGNIGRIFERARSVKGPGGVPMRRVEEEIICTRREANIHAFGIQTQRSVQRTYWQVWIGGRNLTLLVSSQLTFATRIDFMSASASVIRTKTVAEAHGRQLVLQDWVVVTYLYHLPFHPHPRHLFGSIRRSAKSSVPVRVLISSTEPRGTDTHTSGVAWSARRREAEGLGSTFRNEFVG